MMSRTYSAKSWYWSVGGQTPPIYDSASGGYVSTSDPDYLAFLADTDSRTGQPLKATVIANEDELREVLSKAGVKYKTESLAPIEEDRPRVPKARCRVTVTGETVPSATPTALTFDSEQKDPLGFHDPATNPERITISEAGVYLCIGRVRVLESTAGAGGTPNSGTRAVQLRKGLGGGASDEATTRVGAAPSENTEFPVMEFVQFAAGDVLRLFFEQDCGGDLDVQARLSLIRVE